MSFAPTDIVFDSIFPTWVVVTLSIAGVLFSGIGIIKNWRSGLLRLLAVAALLMLLANPIKREAETTPLEDIALILVDQSASQQLDARSRVATSAAESLRQRIEALENVLIETIPYSGDVETRTINAIQQAMADTPRQRLGGVFVITDGQTVDAGEIASMTSVDAPIHVLTTGSETETDRKITLINAPRYGIVRQSVRVSFQIDDFSRDDIVVSDRNSSVVTLRVNGEEVLSEAVPLGTEAGFDVPLNRPGRTIIELEAEERSGELTTRNNIAVLPITAVRDRLRVLLISGEPHPGERVWRNLLKSDPAVDLVHFTILRPIDKNDGTPVDELALIPFPQDELFIDKLDEFDLLIFDRYTYRGVLSSFHFDNIARFVDNGGAVLIASGPEYNGPLSLAMRRNLSFILPALPTGPAVETAFRPLVSDIGKRHPVTADLDDEDIWGRWLRLMPVTHLRGETLLTGPNDEPLLILDRIGEGRVGLFLSDHVWLWARGFDGGGPHASLLRHIAHWLMKEPELEEEALNLSDSAGSLLVERRTIEEEAPNVTIEFPSGETREVILSETEPGLFTAKLDNVESGLYRANSGELFAIGAIGLGSIPEFQNVVSTRNLLEPLARQTAGGVFAVRSASSVNLPDIRRVKQNTKNRAGDDWAGVTIRDAARIENVKDAPLVSPFIWLVLLVLTLLAAWMIESGRFAKRQSDLH
ncbi:hypothetical protein [Hyphococcus sp. DH-69]|uniref:hypothetical protein n=1 Tax=Hyphococcus formosus TaxID=3143534 RepID=UPI00398AEA07